MILEHSPAKVARLDALTSLRFFAAFAVLLYHVPFVLPGASKTHLFAAGGALGVSFFFVLSGFILSYAYPGNQPLNLSNFYLKRFARVYPLHALTLTVWTLLFFGTWGNPLNDRINSGIANVLLLQAFFIGDLYNLGFNAVSWSLSVELLFYAAFPLLRHPAIALACVVAHVGIVSLLMAGNTALNSSICYFNPFARAAEFSIGILTFAVVNRVADRVTPGTIAAVASMGIAAATASTYQVVPVGLQFVWIGAGFAPLIAVCSIGGGWVSRVLQWRWLVLLGEASFALYLLHHMMFRLLQQWVGGYLQGMALLTIATSVVIVASVVIYLTFERGVRDFIVGGRNRRVGKDITPEMIAEGSRG